MPDANLADGDVFTSTFYNTYIREQVVATCTSGTRPTGVEGRLIFETDTDRFYWHTGSAWKCMHSSWEPFTPTWTNLSVGSSPTQNWFFKYSQGDLLVHGRTTLGTSASASGTVTMTVPDSQTSANSQAYSFGHTAYIDSTGADSTGLAIVGSNATAIDFRDHTYTVIDATTPFTWAASDQIILAGLRIAL